ncbi:MAG: VWA domain-containing protein [Phycisphaerales bacterium]|nr:VWA domain-containing protein [Phycisphaerales bacterium]
MKTISDLFTLSRFDRPWALLILLAIVLFWWMSRRSMAGLGPVRGKVSMAMRFVVLALLVLALAGTHKILRNDDLNVMYLLDLSRSVPLDVRRTAERFVVDSTRFMEDKDKATLLTFDGRTNIEQLPMGKAPDGDGIRTDPPFPDGQRPDQTNIAQALRMSIACMAPGMNNRLVILSDGNQNVGDAVEEAKAAKANNLSVDVIPLQYEHGAEVVFEQLKAPPYANLHEQVTLRPIIRSDKETTGEIRIYQRVGEDSKLIDLDPDSEAFGQRIQLKPGRNPFVVRLPITTRQSHEFTAEFIPDDPRADVISENNKTVAYTTVEGPPKVLFVGKRQSQEEDTLLIEALGRENIEVRWADDENLHLSTSVLQDYSAIIIANAGADNFSADQQRMLATYVRDLGGGLVMIGGDDSFGAGGWQGSPVEDVMPVKFDVDNVRQIPKGALAIVMHSCEMPNGNKWGIETAVAALDTVSSLDYYGVMGWGFSGFAWEVPLQQAKDKDAIKQKIRKMMNGDMMDYDTPMSQAFKALMSKSDAAQRHMIIISDGDAQPPSSGLLQKMVANKVTCSTVSIFPHGSMEIGTLKRIAKITKGKYYNLSKPGDEKRLPKIFIKEAKVVRRPLLREETFEPRLNPNQLSDLMAGIDGPFPELNGYVVTTPRKDVPDVEIPLLTKKGDPLMAHWLCGSGRAVAFTSGWWNRWGAKWPEWPAFSKLWAQTIRWCMQQGTAANYDVTTVVDGDRGHLVIESMEEGATVANFRQFAGTLVRPDATSVPMEIKQTGPGRFEAFFTVDQRGAYIVNVAAPGTRSQKAARIRTGVTVAYSPEYRDLKLNEALLREVADLTDGRVLSPDGEENRKAVFAHNLPDTVSRRPIWDTLLKLAIVAFLLDIAVRRIAIDPLKWLATASSYVASLARVGRGRKSEQTLKDLRGVRERIREQRTATSETTTARRPAAPAPMDGPTLDTSAKFDAGATKQPVKDLTEAMGGAGAKADAPPPKPETPKPADAGPQESMTARLLKAKRRAREEGDENK